MSERHMNGLRQRGRATHVFALLVAVFLASIVSPARDASAVVGDPRQLSRRTPGRHSSLLRPIAGCAADRSLTVSGS